ncbi:hypothetical protein KAS45_01800 [candidate division WOR-3 bacterium]|nr:hypothetical protein [candidate division WOR-3 bacterium]
MIVVLLLIIVGVVFMFGLLRERDEYVVLDEVIPEGEVVSREDGIVEYKGVRYVLGTNDLKKKKHLLQKLNLLGIEETLVIDLSYSGQIILKAKKGL